jgi:hypothetical protein
MRRPSKRAIAIALLFVGAASMWLWNQRGGESAVAIIGDELLEAAGEGDPDAVAEVWWLAYWSGKPEIFVSLTDPEIVAARSVEEFIGHSEFHAALNPGAPPLGVSECERAVGFDEVRLVCDVEILGESEGYVWDVGRRQSFSAVIEDGLVTSISFDGYHLDGIDAVPSMVALAEFVDESGFVAACSGDPGEFELFDEPREFFALQDDIVEFRDFVVKRECGEFLRRVLDLDQT